METIIIYIIAPTLTAFLGWFASAWRSRQKREGDILQNVETILGIQNRQIERYDRELNAMERRLSLKTRSIMQANHCDYVAECPVLEHEDKNDRLPDCAACKEKDKCTILDQENE